MGRGEEHSGESAGQADPRKIKSPSGGIHTGGGVPTHPPTHLLELRRGAGQRALHHLRHTAQHRHRGGAVGGLLQLELQQRSAVHTGRGYGLHVSKVLLHPRLH